MTKKRIKKVIAANKKKINLALLLSGWVRNVVLGFRFKDLKIGELKYFGFDVFLRMR